MRIASINTVCYGSTGKIMLQISRVARTRGHEAITFSKTRLENPTVGDEHHFIGSKLSNGIHKYLAEWTGLDGSFSYLPTKRLIGQLEKYKPDVIHLHNIHGWYLNYKLLFNYIKKHDIRVIWTLHDCWAFTGHCPHFTFVKCEKWKTECKDCPIHKSYPKSLIDNAKRMHGLKKEWFNGVRDLTIVTPSRWLADLVGQSFLSEYRTVVINNGIDLSVFKPAPSNFRENYNVPADKKILLGVAFGWGQRKGLDCFIELYEKLDRQRYQIVLVGTDPTVESSLPEGVISIRKTANQAELAEIYSAADLLINPTREDNYPTVNLESIACGTPVITFRTGGSPESITPLTGAIVECEDVDGLISAIENANYSSDDCVRAAQKFDMFKCFEEYVNLYENK